MGESGSGKTTLGRMLLGLLPPSAGRVSFDGVDLASAEPAQRRQLRRRMQIVFQDPQSSLDPRRTVGAQIADGLEIHNIVPLRTDAARVSELLAQVGLNSVACRALSARILRRPAPAHRHCARARHRAGVFARGRTGLSARSVGAGAGARAAGRSAQAARPRAAVHQPRSRGGAQPVRARGGDVSRPGDGVWPGGAGVHRATASLHAWHCCPLCRGSMPRSAGRASCCQAIRRAPPIRHRAACSAPAARSRSTHAPRLCPHSSMVSRVFASVRHRRVSCADAAPARAAGPIDATPALRFAGESRGSQCSPTARRG